MVTTSGCTLGDENVIGIRAFNVDFKFDLALSYITLF